MVGDATVTLVCVRVRIFGPEGQMERRFLCLFDSLIGKDRLTKGCASVTE